MHFSAPLRAGAVVPAAPSTSCQTTLDRAALTDRINAVLPQTQCTRCGYADCHTYAEAIADGLADLNQCPPGGAEGIARLAVVTGQAPSALNPAHGTEGPRRLAIIDETWCIGCTLCIQACPVDAIVGAPKRMHTVLVDWCTGCERCLPPCPMDCIALQPLPNTALANQSGWSAWSLKQAEEARQRYKTRQARQRLIEQRRQDRLREKPPQRVSQPQRLPDAAQPTSTPTQQQRKQAMITAALERARLRQAER